MTNFAAVSKNTTAMNYLSNDELERYWFRYKSEAEPHGTSMERFCQIHKISYKALDNWRRQTKSKIFPVEVCGQEDSASPQTNNAAAAAVTPKPVQTKFISCKHRQPTQPTAYNEPQEEDAPQSKPSVRIMVNLKATNGLSVFQKNLDYAGLRLLVERLEGLC